jgi:perosamine synthetase
MTDKLDQPAILGGKPAVSIPPPHFSWPIISAQDVKAVVKQLKSGQISIFGREGIIEEFEDRFKKYHQRKYAILTNSGTSALHSAFFGCGLGPGDEVIAPTYTFLATVTPIFHCNAVPVLCDAEPETGNIDPEDIEKKITPQTKAIVVTHIWGHPVELDKIFRIAKRYKLFLIEDCSHSHGATYRGRKVGTFGDVACFSFQGNKMLTAGEGGILITNNQEIYERATLLGHYRQRSEQCVKSKFYRQFVKTGYGLKYRIHPLAAALVNSQFDHLNRWIKSRQKNLNYLSRRLRSIPGIVPPVTRPYITRGAFYGYKPHYRPEEVGGLSIENYVKALQAEGLEIHLPGSKPLHLLPFFQTLDDRMYGCGCPRQCLLVRQKKVYRAGDFPRAERFYQNSLSLPTFTQPSRKIIDQYLKGFRKVADFAGEIKNYYKK